MTTTLTKNGIIATPLASVTPAQEAAAKASGFTPTEPTVGAVYNAPAPTTTQPQKTYVGQDGNTYDQTTGQLVAHGDINPVNEDQVRSNVLNQFQAEIDAQNQIYSEKLNEAKTAGVGRLGSARATQARSGLLGSDFAGAQNDNVNTQNNQIESSISQEQAAAIAAIMGKATSEATSQIASKRAAQQAGLSEYLKYLGDRSTQKQTNLSKLAGSLIDQKVTPDTLTPQQLQDLATSYGVTTGDIITAYNAEKTTRDQAQTKIDTQNAKDKTAADLDAQKEAALEKYQAGELSTAQYSAETARLNALSTQYKAGLDANGQPLASSASQTKTDALTSAKKLQDMITNNQGFTASVGVPGITNYLPGTQSADFKGQLKNLTSLLSLDNVKLLKGQGAISDSERALLAEASANLDTSLTEEQFKKNLNDIVTALSGADAGNAGGAIPKGTDGSAYGFPGYVSDGTQWIAK